MINFYIKEENKINDIDWKDLEQKEYMLQNATELRCRYAIYMEELKLSGQREYNILRSLEKEIKTICIQAVDKYSLEVNFDSTAYWLDFENQLKDKIKEYSSLCQINLQESFVYAQMFQIAAECQLKWANKIVTK